MKFAQIVSPARGGLVVGDDAVGLDRCRAVALPTQRLHDDEVGAREGAVRIAVAQRAVDDDVRADALVEDGLRRVEGILDADDRLQRLVVGDDELGPVFGEIPRFRGNRGDRLARVPRTVAGHRVIAELVRDPGGEGIGQLRQLGTGERGRDAGQLQGGRDVDRPELCMRPGRAREGDVQRVRDRDVVHEPAAPGQQRQVFPAQQRLPDPGHGPILTRPSRRLRGSRP